MKENVETVVH